MSAKSTKCENVFENWEDIDEKELERQLVNCKIDNENNQSATGNADHIGKMKTMILPDDMCPPFGIPPEPTVKILRRPTAADNVNNVNLNAKPKIQKKTLQQREQEYAEARLRILGMAKNPDEDLEPYVLTPPPINNAAVNIRPRKQDNPQPSTTASAATFGESTDTNNGPNISLHQDNIIRMPRGPDGTNGFKKRR